METCLGGRRNKQKQQQPQSHHPSHHLQQQFSSQQHHHHQQQQQQQQQQFHPHHHYHNQQQQQQQQQQQTQHFHQKSNQQEKYNPAADFIMHPGFCASSTGSNIRHNNYSPGSHQPPFPHFPPPPDYPPPGMTSLTMKQVNPIAGTAVTPTTSGIGLCSGIASGDSGEGSLSSSGGGTRRKVHRYPDDLDSIEVCLEQEPISIKSFRNMNTTTTTTASGNVGMSNNNSNHGNNLVESHVKWSRSNTSAKIDKFSQSVTSPTTSSTTANEILQHMHQDYSYAYYEPGAAMRHSNIPPPEQTAGPSRPPPPNSIRALLSKGKKNKILVSQSTRQSYQTRYGSGGVAGGGASGGITQENFYEEIGSDGRNAIIASMMHPAGSINQTMVEEELRRVQNRHRKILGELNLSVEAMLMPETPSSGSPTEEEPTTTTAAATNSRSSDNLDELINTVGPTDELLSPVSSTTNPGFCGDLDSGFSGSSGASYIGSLRYHKTNAALSNLINTRNNKCAPIDNMNNSGSNNSGGISSGAIGSFYNSSCRSSQRSNDESDTHGLLSRSSHANASKTLRCIDKSKSVDESTSSTGTGAPVVTESKARSFWNRKGWKNFPGFSSTSSINQTGVDEPKLNSGSWEDPLPISSTVSATTTVTTAQLHNPSIRRSDPLNSRSSFNGLHNQLILPSGIHHHSKSNSGGVLGVGGSIIHPSLGGGGGVVGIIETNSNNSTKSSSKRLEHTPSARTTNSSEDSWCSERSEHDLSSEDEDDVSERSVTSTTQRNSQLRSTFNKAKQHLSFDKWRTSGGGGGNSGNHHQQQQTQSSSSGGSNSSSSTTTTMPAAAHHHHQDTTTPGESPGGRLSRWFSIRRGSTHQYDIGGREGRHSSSSGSIDATDATEHISPKAAVTSSSSSSSGTILGTGSKMPQLPENEDDPTHAFGLDLMLPPGSRANGTARPHSRLITPTLPPAPPGLSQQQLKRRHIVAAIVHSENSYVATLQRLVNDYKKPLEESSPPVLSNTKISTLFHRLPDILQCHKLFRIALADCVRNWDRDEKLGDVFVGAFSKPQVLEVYSGFINNFSAAMELAKMEAKRKSALADFFKVKQISAHDRLSFFGLMVKPVQRFPQFILFLQDLLKYTPQGHHDRMSLQLALTQLESLAEMLNERKREAEQYQAFKEMLGHISGTFNTRSLTSTADGTRQRYLLREDNVTQMEFNQSGFIIKSKQRRLLLLNDKVICVSVAPKQSHDFGAHEKLSFKWMYPVTDVEIVDNSTSATLSRILTAGLNRGGSLKSNSSSSGIIGGGGGGGGGGSNISANSTIGSNSSSSNSDNLATILTNGADNLCNEMSNLMHDYEVISRINDLVGSLKGHYKEINTDITRNLLNTIQTSIQRKDEEMAWVDSCCLQLIARNKSGKEETFTFQTENPSVKKEWITELRLAQLAHDINNSPAWEVPENDHQKPSTKMPLFVKAQPVYKSQHQTEVRCGCYYTITNDTRVGTARRRFKQQNYLWVCTSDGTSSHIAVFSQHHQQAGNLKDVGSFDLVETQVTSMEFVKGLNNCKTKEEHESLLGDLIWMGTDSRRILIYSARNPEQEEQLNYCSVPAVVTKILYHLDCVYVALSNATLLIFRRAFDGVWLLKEPQIIQLPTLTNCPLSSILPINMSIYAGCGSRVYVLNALSGEMQKSFEIQHGNSQQVNLMAHSGIGLWVSLKNSSTICLYHTETFKHLQDINIAANVLRVKSSNKDSVNNNSIYVTALMACKGLLWVGTNVGIAVTIPLPRLEGVPVISGGIGISCHAHFGPITFLLPLLPRNYSTPKQPPVEQQILVNEEHPLEQNNDNSKKNDHENDDSTVILRKDLDESVTSSEHDSPKTKLDKQCSLDQALSAKIRAQLSSPALRRKRYRELSDISRMSKTLPRCLGSAGFFSTSINSNTSTLNHSEHGYCDVYGLYGKLIFVKEDYDAQEGTQGNLMDMMYECMRRSDPELAAIPGKVSTLDRRLRMKASRPRSLDLSNWSVDSKSSSLYTSSGSEESMGIRLFGGRSVSRNSSSASHKTSGNGSDLGNISENGTITVDIHSNPSDTSTPKHHLHHQDLSSSSNASSSIMNNDMPPPPPPGQAPHSAPAERASLKPILQSSINVPTISTSNSLHNTVTSAAAAAVAATTLKKKQKSGASGGKNALNDGPRTLITLMGGRGYWRHVWYTNSPSGSSKNLSSGGTMSRVANSNDAHIVIWEKKL